MRKLILRMMLSFDGVAARENGPLEVLDFADEESWADMFSTLETVDSMLLGAAMHREYLDHWQEALTSPKARPNERKFAEIAARTPHFILSRSLRSVDFPNATVLAGGVAGIAELKRQPGRDMILWGGPTVAGATVEAGLVDEYHLAVHPVLAGRGKKLFAQVETVHRLRQLDSKTLPSGIVVHKYARA